MSPSELAEALPMPIKCDAGGNLYIRTEPDGVTAIHKLNSKGERLALFETKSAGLQIDFSMYISVAGDGSVYELVYPHEISRYVLVFNRDGSLRSTVKLQPGFVFMPDLLTAFPSGDLLVSGLEYDKDPKSVKWPFNGIFGPDGIMKKELVLEDDQMIHDLAAAGDARVTTGQSPSFNTAVTWGQAETGPDGNVYVMRRLSPAIFYAISNQGEVVRRFTVDPGRDNMMPFTMQLAGDRIAVLFLDREREEAFIKVIDLEGRDVATYDTVATDGTALGLAFACYTHNPERFTFLETTEDNKLKLLAATPE